MIRAVRIALFCEGVDSSGESLTIVGVWGHTLLAGNRPGALEAVLLLQLDIDRQPTDGHVRVQVDAYDETFPFAFRSAEPVTALLLRLLLPVLSEGVLTVTVADHGGAEWRFDWRVDAAPDAEPLHASPTFILEACRAAAVDVRARLRGPGVVTVN